MDVMDVVEYMEGKFYSLNFLPARYHPYFTGKKHSPCGFDPGRGAASAAPAFYEGL
jgi:hypothetical protein